MAFLNPHLSLEILVYGTKRKDQIDLTRRLSLHWNKSPSLHKDGIKTENLNERLRLVLKISTCLKPESFQISLSFFPSLSLSLSFLTTMHTHALTHTHRQAPTLTFTHSHSSHLNTCLKLGSGAVWENVSYQKRALDFYELTLKRDIIAALLEVG